MKLNIKVRIKNPWFWIGLAGVILSAMGISPEDLTSWQAVLDMLVEFISNPFMIGTVLAALAGVFFDPTTAGLGDSNQAMTYSKPKKDE